MVRFLLLLFLSGSLVCTAQLRRMTKSHSQWWLGVMAGTNQTKATPIERYSVFESTNGETSDKNYNNNQLFASQLGLILTYDIFAGIGLSLQPKVITYKFGYENEYAWEDSDNNFNNFSVTYEHENKLQYVQIPLIVKYDFIASNFGFGKKDNMFKPFIQFGGAYSMLRDAQKTVTEKGTNNLIEYEKAPNTLDVSPQFITSEWQLQAGGGLNIDINSFRFALVFNYHWGLNNITDKANRFNNHQQTTDFYDVYDDMNLRGWSGSIEAIFPLKFIYDPHYRKSK